MSETKTEAKPQITPASSLDEIATAAYENSAAHGFWHDLAGRPLDPENELVLGLKLSLTHQELSEALDWARESWRRAQVAKGITDQPTIGELLFLKHEYNLSRPHKHGKSC